MKKAIRVLITLILVIAIIGSAAWYLLIYDRDFTRDVLLYQARSLEASGNHKLAAFFYDITYDFADNSEEIAIELATQYKAAGNYTKAEATLSRAIADGGGTKLYIALCKTYVEQDKLLDAVNMLDNITSPIIREAIQAMRPETPIVDRAPDFYNQYIDVTVTAPTGKLYVTSDGVYPSTETSAYQAPITLGNGETTIYALAVDDNGLVSKLGIFGYTVGGVVEVVNFTDPAIESAIREILEVDADDVIYTDHLWEITDFEMPADAEDYTDLKYLPYLKSLTIQHAAEEQLQSLSYLTKLESLSITDSTPTESELATIAALPNLRRLSLIGCNLSTISPLSKATQLEYLDLTDNAIRNIAPLSAMTGLQELYLSTNALTSLAELSGLTSLQVLDVSYNSLTDIGPIAALNSISRLYINNNSLGNIAAVSGMVKLRIFNAADNAVTDISALAPCTQLTELNISNNLVEDISVLGKMQLLENLNFAYNAITELPAFQADYALVNIDGSYNQLASLEPLSGMESLNVVLMDYNEDIQDANILKTCHNLVRVSVFGTKVADVSALTEQSVIVNFDPTQ